MTLTADSEEREHLEQERDFLLRSLDDLEAERVAGDVDDESYGQLHDDYTARAAAVIRALRDGVDARPVQAPARRRTLAVGAIAAFAVLAGVALAAALGARLPGETSSGNTPQVAQPRDNTPTRREQLEKSVAANPDAPGPRLLLAQQLESDGDYAGALRQYDEMLRIDPKSAEAEAQAGRILYLTAASAAPEQAAALVDRSKQRLDHAVELDPGYADARYFRAIVLANEYQDFAGAQRDLQEYLIAKPDGEFSGDARQLLAQVTSALEGP